MGQANSRQEEFWEACSYGREWLVELMIEEGQIDINWVSHISDCAPIHVASQGDIKIVRHLIKAKCNVNAKDIHGNTALHHAAMAGKADVCEALLEAGADIDAVNLNGWTPLINACYWCRPAVAELLLAANADHSLRNKEGRQAIHEMCRSKVESQQQELDLVRILECLLEAGSQLSERSDSSEKYSKSTLDLEMFSAGTKLAADFTPLLFACYHGHLELVRRMLEIDDRIVDQTDTNGWTALHWAAQRGNIGIVTLLLVQGADLDFRGKRNESPADVTNDILVQQMLTDPNYFPYPHIETNGSVTTDEEDESQAVDIKAVRRNSVHRRGSASKPSNSNSGGAFVQQSANPLVTSV